MKLRELINRLETVSENGKNDDFTVIVSQPDTPTVSLIEDIYGISSSTIKYIAIEIE